MENPMPTENEPFGRQPQPVTVILSGDPRDVDHFITILQNAAERDGGLTERRVSSFKIYPRAVND